MHNVVLFNEFAKIKGEAGFVHSSHMTCDYFLPCHTFRHVHPLYQIMTAMTMHAAGENVFKLSLFSSF